MCAEAWRRQGGLHTGGGARAKLPALPADNVRRHPRDRASEAKERHMRVVGAAVQTRQNCGRVT